MDFGSKLSNICEVTWGYQQQVLEEGGVLLLECFSQLLSATDLLTLKKKKKKFHMFSASDFIAIAAFLLPEIHLPKPLSPAGGCYHMSPFYFSGLIS